ncbi:MAG: hypothetical protein QXY35_06135, partial [Thermofilaceae archaeon]
CGWMRGEAEVVAVLLTTLVVVGGFAVLWVWLYPRYLWWERRFTESAQAAREAARERVVVELVRCRNGFLEVDVTCTGDIGVRIVSVYFNESLVWSGSLYIAPGERKTIATSRQCAPQLVVKVCSARGNCWSFVEKLFSG